MLVNTLSLLFSGYFSYINNIGNIKKGVQVSAASLVSVVPM